MKACSLLRVWPLTALLDAPAGVGVARWEEVAEAGGVMFANTGADFRPEDDRGGAGGAFMVAGEVMVLGWDPRFAAAERARRSVRLQVALESVGVVFPTRLLRAPLPNTTRFALLAQWPSPFRGILKPRDNPDHLVDAARVLEVWLGWVVETVGAQVELRTNGGQPWRVCELGGWDPVATTRAFGRAVRLRVRAGSLPEGVELHCWFQIAGGSWWVGVEFDGAGERSPLEVDAVLDEGRREVIEAVVELGGRWVDDGGALMACAMPTRKYDPSDRWSIDRVVPSREVAVPDMLAWPPIERDHRSDPPVWRMNDVFWWQQFAGEPARVFGTLDDWWPHGQYPNLARSIDRAAVRRAAPWLIPPS